MPFFGKRTKEPEARSDETLQAKESRKVVKCDKIPSYEIQMRNLHSDTRAKSRTNGLTYHEPLMGSKHDKVTLSKNAQQVQTMNLVGTERLLETNSDMDVKISDLPEKCSPTIFDGKRDILGWLTEFELYAHARGWDKLEQMAALPCFLKGSALTWYQYMDPKKISSIENLKEALTQWFGPHPADKWEACDRYFERKQKLGETVNDFCLELFKIGRETGRNSDEIKDDFVKGLLPHIADYVIENISEEYNIEQALFLARKAYALKATVGSHNETIALANNIVTENPIIKSNDQSQKLRRSSEKQDVYPTFLPGVFCFRCKAEGHVCLRCPTPKRSKRNKNSASNIRSGR